MAHEIARMADGRDAMAYVGSTPWHGLGQSLTKGASIGVWKKEAGLDWLALSATPYVDTGDDELSFNGHKAIYRSDTKAPLSIVGADYNIVQPGEVLEFFRELVESETGWWIHTAGVLKGGRKVWAMATNGQEASVGRTDRIKHNLLMATSLDGSMATTVMETSVRVVCNNTLSLADRLSGDSAIRVSHRGQFDKHLVHRLLGTDIDRFGTFMRNARELAETPISLDEARHHLEVIFKVDKKKEAAPNLAWMGSLGAVARAEVVTQDVTSRGLEKVLALFQGEGKGADLKTSKGTRWGLLNAVTEYADWHAGRTDDSRLESTWFGRSAQLKDAMHSALLADLQS